MHPKNNHNGKWFILVQNRLWTWSPPVWPTVPKNIGLWSAGGELDYLESSVEAFRRYLGMLRNDDEEEDRSSPLVGFLTVTSLSTAEVEAIVQNILQHHKLTAYNNSTVDDSVAVVFDENLVNAFRTADWADATLGALRYGLPADCWEMVYRAIPEADFHTILVGMGSRLRPNTFLGGRLQVLNILKWEERESVSYVSRQGE